MRRRRRDRRATRGRRAKVWVALHEYKNGSDLYVAESREALHAELADLIRRFWWTDAVEVGGAGVPARPPADDAECVRDYFRVMGEQFEAEWLREEEVTVASVEARGARGGAGDE